MAVFDLRHGHTEQQVRPGKALGWSAKGLVHIGTRAQHNYKIVVAEPVEMACLQSMREVEERHCRPLQRQRCYWM